MFYFIRFEDSLSTEDSRHRGSARVESGMLRLRAVAIISVDWLILTPIKIDITVFTAIVVVIRISIVDKTIRLVKVISKSDSVIIVVVVIPTTDKLIKLY